MLKLLEEKIQLIRSGLNETEKALEQRKSLHKRFAKQIQEEKKEAMTYLGFLGEPWRGGYLPRIESLRVSLHRSVTARAEKLRAEELKYFEQVTALEEKHRQLQLELLDLLQRKRSLAS